ncbi:cuticle protein 18.6-like [Rhynchophorus ferrugineus]|uniref:cuticle protein 18.6-like n=1 Tax=Rhynchophorus ferrugineus TaxID=354439 RepID=UPI003FCCBA68
MYKFFVVAFLAVVSAAPADYQATSFVKFNDNHNAVSHAASAPASPLYAAPVAKVAVPDVPVVAKYAVPAAPVYSVAPAVTKVALPVVAKVAPVAYAAPVAKYAPAPAYKEESYEPIPYEFNYGIQDPHTGDFHSQEEKSDGHHVVGQYSLHEADGTVRIVKYSDDGHGFNAVVERQGEPTPAPAVYKKVVAVAAPHY